MCCQWSLPINYYTSKPHGKCSYYIKAIYHTFQWFIGSINHLGCWNNTRKACKSLACVASVSVRFYPRSRHFLLFSRAKIGASHALFCARPNFPAAKKAKSTSNVRKVLPKRLLRRLVNHSPSARLTISSRILPASRVVY